MNCFSAARARANGPDVSREDWDAFVDAEITPRFPDGLTWFEGRGQWRSPSGAIVRERSWMLILLAPPGAATETSIEAIRTAYRARFGQDSVLRANSMSCVTF